jgi:hypothetical protein
MSVLLCVFVCVCVCVCVCGAFFGLRVSFRTVYHTHIFWNFYFQLLLPTAQFWRMLMANDMLKLHVSRILIGRCSPMGPVTGFNAFSCNLMTTELRELLISLLCFVSEKRGNSSVAVVSSWDVAAYEIRITSNEIFCFCHCFQTSSFTLSPLGDNRFFSSLFKLIIYKSF